MDERFRRKLLHWYGKHGRDLPWRRTDDPYAVWVSEVMLQQTQVGTVLPYYERFLRRFPTVHALARADEAEVLRLWEGLGYYRRARHLQQAARQLVREHGGNLPPEAEALQQLPGIGPNTAAAIASLAFGTREPLLEANTRRLYCRLLALEEDPSRPQVQRKLWTFARSLLPEEPQACRKFNQALMDLGAMICTPRNPACPRCPVSAWCRAYQAGKQNRIPSRTSRTRTEARREGLIALRAGNRWLVRRCTEEERWSGLWDLVRVPLCGTKPVCQQARERCAVLTGMQPQQLHHLGQWHHSITRFRIQLECFLGTVAKARAPKAPWCWIEQVRLRELPLNVTARKLFRQAVRHPA